MPGESDAQKIAELNAIVEAVRNRVRNGYPPGEGVDPASGTMPPIRITPPDLMPLVHARDAAQAKVAAIGGVNPRAGGLLNKLVQTVKKLIARALQWFVRDQVVFNRETISALEAVIEALADQNRALQSLASQSDERFASLRSQSDERFAALHSQLDERFASLRSQIHESREIAASAHRDLTVSVRYWGDEVERLGAELQRTAAAERELAASVRHLGEEVQRTTAESARFREEMRREMHDVSIQSTDIRQHWIEWRAGWEHKLATNEIQFLRAAADLQGAFQHRVTLIETNFREMVRAQHGDYLGALDRTNLQIQKQFGADLARVREAYERMIHSELRLIRLRAGNNAPVLQAGSTPGSTPAAQTVSPPVQTMDYSRFAERFRGTEEEIRRNMEFYKPFFAGCENVLDIGCGRGEFLETMREAGTPARGIDLSAECVAQCAGKGLQAEVADLFAFLAAQPDGEFDGIMSSQVVEHLPADRVPEMIRLCAAKLRRGGVLVIETPNPECLAIFATYFYLDPTHTRPMPHQYIQFCMEEAGMSGFELHRLAPAIDTMPELASLPGDFRERFFGGLDYAIIGRVI